MNTAGATQQEIANALGKSRTAVKYWAKKFGIKLRSTPGPRPGSRPSNADGNRLGNGGPAGIKRGDCKVCFAPLHRRYQRDNTFCSYKCFSRHRFEEAYRKWIDGSDLEISSNLLRKLVLRRDGYRCTCCGRTEWMGRPITLEVDHVDGNSSDHRPDNVRAMCPNCHSQTETYKSGNRGNGRWVLRRQRGAPELTKE